MVHTLPVKVKSAMLNIAEQLGIRNARRSGFRPYWTRNNSGGSSAEETAAGQCRKLDGHGPVSLTERRSEPGVMVGAIRWQHRLKRERPTCTERTKSLLESADGRMASADSAKEKACPTKIQKNPLDSDRPSHGRRLHSLRLAGRINECNGDFSTAERLTYRQLISSH